MMMRTTRYIFKDAINELSETLKCEIANNGREALDYIETPPLPDCIFLDLNMPVMNGYECLAYLKTEERYKHIPGGYFHYLEKLT
jgi:CheY-like chemotaxis protein